MTRWIRKLGLLAGRSRFRSDLDEEMAFHRALAERDLLDSGMKPQAARYAAMRQLGNETRLREQSEEVVGFRVETVWQDVRFAMRQLRKNPGFGLTAMLILALGMGVSVAIFGFVDAALIQPLPYAQPNRLLSVDESSVLIPRSNLSYADYQDWKRLNKSLSSLDVQQGTGFLLRASSGIEPVPGARVTDGFFSTLGVRMMLGRGFLPGEDMAGKPKIVILTYGTWLKRFGGRRDIVGQTVNLNSDSYTVVGVLPREFAFAPRAIVEFWTPLLELSECEKRRSCHDLDGIGRLRDGVTIEAARAEMKGIAAQLAIQYPGSNKDQGADVVPMAELIIGPVRPVLLTLLGAAGLLLLIACVNVASLLLVRSESRRREVAVRGALGATKARMLRQFVTEGLLLATAGCAVGLLCGSWIMKLILKLVPKQMSDNVPFLSNVGLNGHTALFAGSVALGAAVLLAATPALRLAGQNMHAALAEGGRGAAGRFWQRLGMNLVVAELTVAVVLLAGAGLLGKSLYRLLHVEMGFEPSHMATVQVMAPQNTYAKPEQLMALYREIERRMSALPGIQSVGITSDLPVQCNCDTDWIRIVGKPFHGEHNEVNERDVSADYLRTLRARLIRGRSITEADDRTKPQVVVINEALAKKYFPGDDPIGQKIANGGLDPKSVREIVGVVADVREGGLDQDLWPAEYESIYYGPGNFIAVAVRTSQDEKTVLPVIVSTMHAIDKNLGVFGEITMNDQIQSSQAALLHSFAMWLVGGFAVMALVLGVVGLYGVVAYSVSQRTREIGVRMALGAQRSTVYGMVMRQAAWLTVVGVGLGLVCSVGASLAIRQVLFGVAAWDVPTLALVSLVLGASSLAASFLPARRAASVNPMEALRAE
jgi:macrolide transport system ATP-binding/permease protein